MKELYREETRETALNVTQGRVDSVRRKNIVRSGCRVYEDGCIGVAGTLGEATEKTWAQARANLTRRLPYPYPPEANLVRHEDRRQEVLDAQEFISRMELLLEKLRAAFPRMILSNKISMHEEIVRLQNDAGLDLESRDLCYNVLLIVKDVDSTAVFDTATSYLGRTLDVEQVFTQVSQVLAAHGTPVALPEAEKLPLIVDDGSLLSYLGKALNGQQFYRGSSILSGRVGEQILSPEFTLYVDRSAEEFCIPFFDMEGVTLPDDHGILIENGTLLRAGADKKTAAEFAVEPAAVAGGGYDDVPQLALPHLQAASCGRTLRELLGGRDAIYAVIMSGGDCTDEGVFSSPVQASYLCRDGKLVGRLPEFSVRASLFDLFGKDFLGRTSDGPFSGLPALVAEVTVVR